MLGPLINICTGMSKDIGFFKSDFLIPFITNEKADVGVRHNHPAGSSNKMPLSMFEAMIITNYFAFLVGKVAL